MITHRPHVLLAQRALARLDAGKGSELGPLAVRAAEALRVLLYEPEDGYQGDDERDA